MDISIDVIDTLRGNPAVGCLTNLELSACLLDENVTRTSALAFSSDITPDSEECWIPQSATVLASQQCCEKHGQPKMKQPEMVGGWTVGEAKQQVIQ